jgi:uncharacterized Zn-finger protein
MASVSSRMNFQVSTHELESYLAFPQNPPHIINANLKSSSNPFSCPLCGQTFTRNKALQDHLHGPKHANLKPFKCSLCQKAFTRSNDLTRHELEVHHERKYVCEELLATGHRRGCGKRFTRKLTLEKHREGCEDFNNPKLQPEDQITWPSLPEARIRGLAKSKISEAAIWTHHIWTHDEEFFVCKICKARRLKNLRVSFIEHLLGHLEDIEYEAYQCSGCSARFVFQDHLSRHKQICGKSFCCLLDDELRLVWGCGDHNQQAQRSHSTGCGDRWADNCKRWKELIIEQMSRQGINARESQFPTLQDFIDFIRREELK